MRLNLWLRTGHRVLFLVERFRARDGDELYRRIVAMPWETLIAGDGYLCVTSNVENETITDTRFANLRVKDAIVDRMREATGQRPNSGPDRGRTVIFLYWKGRECSLYLDTSGEPLSRRGYRRHPWKAPMQETLAAAVALSTRWDRKGPFVNPMCGSGTLAIEAALFALNRAPGLLRGNFGFMHVEGWPRRAWIAMKKEAEAAIEKKTAARIVATDIHPRAVAAARENARRAGVERAIEFEVCDYAKTPIPEGQGVVILNPEYGERVGDVRRLEAVYAGIGDFLKQRCRGNTGYVFTGNLALAKKVGLRTSRRMKFFNGGLECRLLEYPLY